MDYHCGCFDMYILHCIDINICSEEKSSRFSFLLIVTSPRLQRLRVWGCYKTLSCRRQIKGAGEDANLAQSVHWDDTWAVNTHALIS